jgi:hypothetical protein
LLSADLSLLKNPVYAAARTGFSVYLDLNKLELHPICFLSEAAAFLLGTDKDPLNDSSVPLKAAVSRRITDASTGSS